MKIMSDGAVSSLRSPSMDAAEVANKESEWDPAGGLDGLMLSVSNSNLSSMSGSKDNLPAMATSISNEKVAASVAVPLTVFSTHEVETPSPAVAAPASAVATPIAAASIGSLCVTSDPASDLSSTSAGLVKSTMGAAKKVTSGVKKSVGARKLGDGLDLKMDSFEVVEKNAAKARQEEEDHKLSLKLQSGDNASSGGGGGSSRLAAVYQEAESIYRAAPTSTSSSSSTSIYSGRPTSSSTGGSSKITSSSMGESYEARERFSKSKSISSDQFFGRDEEDAAAARARLQRYSGATAISSDMLQHDAPPPDVGHGRSGSMSRGAPPSSGGGDVGLGKLKESVRDFFDTVQSRFN